MAYYNIVEYDSALTYIFKAVTIAEKKIGEKNSKTAIYYYNLAITYYQLTDFDMSLKYYKVALDIFTNKMDHEMCVRTLNSLGIYFLEEGKFRKALNYFNQSVTICEEQIGNTSVYSAETFNIVGYAYLLKQKYDEALKYLKKAETICESTLGFEKQIQLQIYKNLASVYRGEGDYVEAKKYSDKSFECWIKYSR